MRVFGALVATAIVFSPPAAAQDPARFEPRDLMHLERAADAQISPDGTWIAYLRKSNSAKTDRSETALWLVEPSSGRQVAVPYALRDVSNLRWAPDGTALAFIATSKDGHPAIFIHRPAQGKTTLAARLTAQPRGFAWSADGRRLAFAVPEPATVDAMGTDRIGPRGADWGPSLRIAKDVHPHTDGAGFTTRMRDRLLSLEILSGKLKQLTPVLFDDVDQIAWSPDGTAIVFAARSDALVKSDVKQSALYRLGIANRSLAKLTNISGPATSPSYAPDGHHIAFLGYEDVPAHTFRNSQVYIMDADGSHPHSITGHFDRNFDTLQWASDGNIYGSYVDHGAMKVSHISVAGENTEVAVDLAGYWPDVPYTVTPQYSVARNGHVAYIRASQTRTPDVAIVSGGVLRNLTSLSEAQLSTKHLGATRKLAVTARDGTSIDAWMVLPPDFDATRKWPLILDIHGGPFISYGPMFASDHQIYAAAGYVVLYANPRGSTDRGSQFANAIALDWPGVDYGDLMDAVDAAIGTGFVERDRMFVTGGSAGGTMTAWIVGKTDRFRAAVAQKPIVNWSSGSLTSQERETMDLLFEKPPWIDFPRYWSKSPLSLAGSVTTPTMVMVGDLDAVTPPSEAEQFYAALRMRSVPTALIEIPGAGHDLSARPSQSAAKASAVLEWFRRYDIPKQRGVK